MAWIGSVQALHGGEMNPIYAAVKNGQRGLVKALALKMSEGLRLDWQFGESAQLVQMVQAFLRRNVTCSPMFMLESTCTLGIPGSDHETARTDDLT